MIRATIGRRSCCCPDAAQASHWAAVVPVCGLTVDALGAEHARPFGGDSTRAASSRRASESRRRSDPQVPPVARIAGTGKALDRLAEYYLDLAENLFPVLEVDAGRGVEVILNRSVGLELQ